MKVHPLFCIAIIVSVCWISIFWLVMNDWMVETFHIHNAPSFYYLIFGTPILLIISVLSYAILSAQRKEEINQTEMKKWGL